MTLPGSPRSPEGDTQVDGTPIIPRGESIPSQALGTLHTGPQSGIVSLVTSMLRRSVVGFPKDRQERKKKGRVVCSSNEVNFVCQRRSLHIRLAGN